MFTMAKTVYVGHNKTPLNNNNNNIQDDINSAVYTAPAICESSLWIIWTTES